MDGYDITSLDEYPIYNDTAGLIRVWSFRLVFVCAVIGAVLALRDRRDVVWMFVLLVLFNMGAAFFIKGQERARIFLDPYIILLAAYFIVAVYRRFRPARSDGHFDDEPYRATSSASGILS
jgi:hypothetical protein